MQKDKAIDQLMRQVSTTTTKQPTFSAREKDSIAYFFLRLQNTFGISKMLAVYPDEKSIALARREYGKFICNMKRQEINELFDLVHEQRQMGSDNFLFPDIDAILGLKRQVKPQASYHRLYEPKYLSEKQVKEQRQRNVLNLKKLKQQLDMA